jgi:hypothetical protein
MSEERDFATLIADVVEGLRQPPGNYSRYSLVSIKNALNLANLEVATRTLCLHSFAIMVLKAGYGQYPSPSDMLAPKRALLYQSVKSYVDLTRDGWKDRVWLDKYRAGWRAQSGDPNIAYIGDSSAHIRKIGFTPTPDTDGNTYVGSSDYGVVTAITGMTVTGNIIGLNSAASATVCTDGLARTLANLGALVGMMALNVTDGSSGQITDITGSTFTVTLAGGTLNTWSIGDNWTILVGEYGVVTSIDGDEEYVFSSNYGELVSISALTGNVYLEYYRKPLTLVTDDQYPEVPTELHMYLPEFAIWWLKRRSAPGSDDLNEAMVAKQIFDEKIPPAKYTPVDHVVEVSQIRYNW